MHFETKRDFHKFSLNDIYDILHEFVTIAYSDDLILKELITIDYYLHHKVKPQNLYIDEIERSKKSKLIAEHNLNHHKYRYIIIPVSFDYRVFNETNTIEKQNTNIIIQYDGVNKSEVIHEIMEIKNNT